MGKSKKSKRDLTGQSFAFFGHFGYWPGYHSGPPAEVAKRLGATVKDKVDESLTYLVIGDKPQKGRADAKRKAEKLQAKAKKQKKDTGAATPVVKILDEAEFREMVRIDLTGKRFAFAGGFDCCGMGYDEALMTGMVEAVGGKVQTDIDAKLDYAVIGDRRRAGKQAAQKQAQALVDAGAKVTVLTEASFLELVRKETTSGRSKTNFASFFSGLYGYVNKKKLERALKMLKAESFQLYSKVNEEGLIGIVKSQTGVGTVYSPWLKADGRYGCSTPELEDCMGMQGEVCKHLLVLLVGLTKTETLDIKSANAWIRSAANKRPKSDTDAAAEAFLLYKGAEAGEIDWRPTETIPEDFYAL